MIERAAAGDRASSEGLIRAHQASLYAYILRLCGKPELAEDIVQDAFVRVLTNLERFDPPRSIGRSTTARSSVRGSPT